MSENATDEPVLLDPDVDPSPERTMEHPDEVTEGEASDGHAMYLAIADTDDADNGLNPRMAANATAVRRANLIKACLLRHGVPEVSIELQSGRPSSDAWNACKPFALISHHIASTPTPAKPTPGLSLVKRGRSDLPGPLANGTAGVDLVYRILTCGLANHPGTGGPWTVKGPVGSYTVPKDVARAYTWGTEYEGGYSDAVWNKTYTNKRTGASMTFREFMGRVNAGLAEAIWLINGRGHKPATGANLSGYHGEHKTWAPARKVDRLNYSTASGRAEIVKYNNEEDDMGAAEVWGQKVIVAGGSHKGEQRTVLWLVMQSQVYATAAYAQIIETRKIVATLAAEVGGAQGKKMQDALDAMPDPESLELDVDPGEVFAAASNAAPESDDESDTEST